MTTRNDSRLPARFWEKVWAPGEGCWTWMAVRTRNGYGKFRLDGGMRLAHRVAYEALVGPVPEGADLDHLCRNRACVNPAHLEPVTHRENVLRGESPSARRAAQTHCVRGHDLSDAYISKRGERKCRACQRLRDRARRLAIADVKESR